jgi:GNAT superfamily N-acetyltransferase
LSSELKNIWSNSLKFFKFKRLDRIESDIGLFPVKYSHLSTNKSDINVFVVKRTDNNPDLDEPIAMLSVYGTNIKIGKNIKLINKIKIAIVQPKYQGQGIGYALYKGLIEIEDWTVMSDDHSKGARKLWSNLNSDPNISVWLYESSSTLEARNAFQLKNFDTEIDKLYNNKNLRLIATKKNSSVDKLLTEFNKLINNSKE